MSDFDLIAVGGGTGNDTASAVARSGLDVALVEKRSLGGTCLTRGSTCRRRSSTGRSSNRNTPLLVM